MQPRAIYYIHWALFFLFLGAVSGAIAVWVLTDSLAFAGIMATGAALIATTSAFLERLFPRQG